jgi:hypothetical protein
VTNTTNTPTASQRNQLGDSITPESIARSAAVGEQVAGKGS